MEYFHWKKTNKRLACEAVKSQRKIVAKFFFSCVGVSLSLSLFRVCVCVSVFGVGVHESWAKGLDTNDTIRLVDGFQLLV